MCRFLKRGVIEHPAVSEAGVIGKPDPPQGGIVKAFITLRKGYVESKEQLEEIRVFVKNYLAARTCGIKRNRNTKMNCQKNKQ